MKGQKKLVILDRDGVINADSDDFIRSADEFVPIPGSIEAIAKLYQSGHMVVVATNQSGLSRGYFDMADLNGIHKKLHHLVEDANGRIEAIFFCPHTDADKCACRKPKPGMFEEICLRFDVPAEKVFAVGDSLRDLLAAQSAGCKPVLVLTGNGKKTLKEGSLPENFILFDDLLAFANSQGNL